MSHISHIAKELTERELDQVVGGEAPPAGNGTPAQIVSPLDTGSSPDWGSSRQEWRNRHNAYASRYR